MSENNTDIGFTLFNLPPLAKYEKDAVLYVAFGDGDFHIRFEVLMDYLVTQAGELQIPEDVVRTQAMQDAIKSAIDNIEPPEVQLPELNYDEIASTVLGTELFRTFKETVAELVQQGAEILKIDLSKFVNKTDIPTNVPVMMNEAQQLVAANFGSSRLLYVVGRVAVEGEVPPTGSLHAPFRDIQSAINASQNGANCVVVVMPAIGGGDYVGFTVDSKTNTTVMGFGLVDAHMVKITGPVINKGTGTRFRLKDVQLAAKAPNGLVYHSQGTEGRDYFENVSFEAGSQAGPNVVLENVKNWIDFKDCNINGEVSIIGEAGPKALVAMRGNNATGTHVTLDSEVTLLINGATRFGSIKQLKGSVQVNYSHTFAGKNGVAIDSQGGEIELKFSDFLGKKVLRSMELNPVKLFNTLAEVDGPSVDYSYENVYSALAPAFVMGVEGASPSKTAKVMRIATRGYYYEGLVGKLVQVATGEKPHAEGALVTSFEMTYADTQKDVEFQHDPSKGTLYLVLTDTANQGRDFVFGPYPN